MEIDFEKLGKQFNELFHDKGGKFYYPECNPDPLLEYRFKFYKHIGIIRKKYPSIPFIYFDYIPNDNIGAVVSKKNDIYFIGLYTGCYFSLMDLYFKLLSSKEVLPEIGDVSKEVN